LRSIGILLFNLFLAASAAAGTNDPTLLVFGDSLSAAYGLRADQGWVALLQKRLVVQGYGYRVVNASVSGETSSGGLARLDRALSLHHPKLVILELGANDGLRGLPLKNTRSNLDAMLTVIKRAKAKVLLIGILIPPNYGASYTNAFGAMFGDLAAKHKIAQVPFLLEKVALKRRYMQDDGLHPNAQGQPLVLDTVWPRLKPLLEH
jgi:acyl-CoA thioesterase I